MRAEYNKNALESLLQGGMQDLSLPPPTLLEQRVFELELLGLADVEEELGMPSSVRRFAAVSLQSAKPSFYITTDRELLRLRDVLEYRYGMSILSISEALLLLHETDGPPN
ncbi:MAG: hypothetical protein ACYC7E_16285 [Armatimonadota bacterium]